MSVFDRQAGGSTEADDVRAAFLRVLLVGAPAFFLFLPLDLYVRASHYPDVSPWVCVLWRAVGAVCVLAGWLLVRSREHWSMRALVAVGMAVMTLSLLCLALLSIDLGGLQSSYLFSPSFYAVGMATFVPTKWRMSLLIAGPAIALFVGTIALGVALDPQLSRQFDDPRIVAEFVQSSLRIIGIVGFATISGHVLWRAHMRLRDAYRLGRYLLRQQIGEGGMNEVWLAHDSHLKREVALKILNVRHPDDARRRRFEREARATSGLHSPHTVRIFDYGQSGRATFWIAMEYLRGLDLEKMVQLHGPIEPRRALHFARQAASALAEAHERGIVHRDIKPANLFALSASEAADFVKVVDFGIARQMDSQEASLTMIGMVVGTPAFMSPEVLTGAAALPSSDVWSFGATLYTLLTGTLPFDFSAGRGTVRQLLPPPSERLGKPLPEALDELVMRCMEVAPDRRPADGQALVEALRALPIEPWTIEEARAWWTAHTGTVTDAPRDGSDHAPTEVDAKAPA